MCKLMASFLYSRNNLASAYKRGERIWLVRGIYTEEEEFTLLCSSGKNWNSLNTEVTWNDSLFWKIFLAACGWRRAKRKRWEKSKGDWRHGDLQEYPRYLENRDEIQLDWSIRHWKGMVLARERFKR